MKAKRKRQNDELNVWQPMTDMFSALVLILLLVILLLALYLVNIPDDTQIDPDPGSSVSSNGDGIGAVISRPETAGGDVDGDGDHTGGGEGDTPDGSSRADLPGGTTDHDGGGGGGGGGTGTGTSPDKGIKSAVYVVMVDAETDRTIKEEGVQFELYSTDNALQVLNVYYPEKISFRNYETTEAGTFYFPEKIYQGSYYVHELTEPAGYDAAENQYFDLDDLYDWPEPFVVKIPLSPSRNIIRIQMNDAETGLAVTGGTFDVIAKTDILTQDGTLRYREGQIVDTITCDEDGYGESSELYLGEYTVRQKDIPEYYAGQADTLDCTVEKKSEAEAPLNTLEAERTRVTLHLTDELYSNRPIEGAVFQITADNGTSTTATTDASGQIVLEQLAKSTTYTIRQLSSVDDYRLDGNSYTFSVTADGRIDGETSKTLDLTNRVLRVSIGAASNLLGGNRAGVDLALYDSNDTLIHSWTTTAAPLTLTDLAEGSYYVTMGDNTEKKYTFPVSDQAAVQSVNVGASPLARYLLIGGGAAAAAGVLIAGIVALVRRRKKKNQDNEKH